MPRIALDGVLKAFAGADGKSVTAVDRLTLEVKDREMLTLVGPSGCGKSTTLRLIAGLETAEAGRILFDDQPVTTLPPADRDVAMVFQSHALFPHFTAFDNLALGLKLRHLARPEINSRVRDAAGMLGLTYCLDRKPGSLSGGERQRVALGRALVRRPKILLLDEPFSNLDEPLRAQLRSELLAVRSRLAMTVIYVTHDQAEALALGDRVAVLRQGKLQQVAAPREIYDAPANTFVADFIGSPPMNLFHGQVAQRDGQCGLLVADTNSKAPTPPLVLPLGGWRADWFSQNVGRPVLLGIRPGDVSLNCDASSDNRRRTTRAVVKSLQYLGDATLIRLAVGAQDIVVRTGPFSPLQPGQTAGLSFDFSRARVYDATTGVLLL